MDDPESLTTFLDILKPGDLLLIIAQSSNDRLIAGLDADWIHVGSMTQRMFDIV